MQLTQTGKQQITFFCLKCNHITLIKALRWNFLTGLQEGYKVLALFKTK